MSAPKVTPKDLDALTFVLFRAQAAKVALELRGLHRAVHPDCVDRGPATCPTWEAIYIMEGRQ